MLLVTVVVILLLLLVVVVVLLLLVLLLVVVLRRASRCQSSMKAGVDDEQSKRTKLVKSENELISSGRERIN